MTTCEALDSWIPGVSYAWDRGDVVVSVNRRGETPRHERLVCETTGPGTLFILVALGITVNRVFLVR